MQFANFGAPFTNVLTSSRYFQYRLILESDDSSSLCDYGAGPASCSPEVKSVSVGDDF